MGFNGANEIRILKIYVDTRIKVADRVLSNFKVELSDLSWCQRQILRASETKWRNRLGTELLRLYCRSN